MMISNMPELAEKKVPLKALRRQILTLLSAYHNIFMTGCTVGWIPNAIYFLQYSSEISASFSQSALIASSSQVGRLVAALPVAIMVDKFGRKNIQILSGLIHFISWVILSTSSTLTAIVVARFGLGAATSLVNAVSLISIGEVASPEIRGKLIGILQICFSLGSISMSIVCVLFSSYMMMSYFCLTFSALFFITLFWINETPYYLISISETDGAKTSLRGLRKGYSEQEINVEYEKLQSYIKNEKQHKLDNDWWEFLRSQSIRKPIIFAVVLNLLTAAQGVEVSFTYITTFIPDNPYVSQQYYPLCALLLDFGITLIVPFYIEKIPRRVIFMTGVLIVTVNFFILGVLSFSYETVKLEILRWLFIFICGIDSIVIGGSIQPMSYATMSEIFPQTVKGLGASLCIVAQSAVNIVLYGLVDLVSDFGYMFFIFSVNSIILFFHLYFNLPESRGKYLEDLQKNLINFDSKIETKYGSA